ncbi:hypothetical protein HAX54_036218 [Datura stramonium]|uniref:IBH1-like N-terminal domain-containing protein n=1 Tax=Datura stramonium TaxID=4076 RepID=A0ABS8VHR9_DATST|nr:hypothetical protein [Datura stramonium]
MTTTTTRARYLHLSPSSIKTRFAYRFLRALRKLNQQKKPNSRKQYHRVKLAAYASMASAVGSKRAWSRALLWKIRNRNLMKKKRRCYVSENPREEIGFVELRKLVPGGEVMDFDNLLDESADYIKCLASQLANNVSIHQKGRDLMTEKRKQAKESTSSGASSEKLPDLLYMRRGLMSFLNPVGQPVVSPTTTTVGPSITPIGVNEKGLSRKHSHTYFFPLRIQIVKNKIWCKLEERCTMVYMNAVIFKSRDYYGVMASQCKRMIVGRFVKSMPQIDTIRSRFSEKSFLKGCAKTEICDNFNIFIAFTNDEDYN